MSAVITTLLQITVYSTVLYLAILLIKKIFHGSLSPAFQYAVWWLLILRLLIPVTVDSGIHLIVLPPAQAAVTAPAGRVASAAGDTSISPQTDVQMKPESKATAPMAAGAGGAIPLAAKQIGWQGALILVWAAGVLVSLIYRAILWWRLCRKIDRASLPVPVRLTAMVEECKREMGIRAPIGVSLQSFLQSPALSSSLRPKLLLPESALHAADDWQIEYGIRHELTHYRRRDYLANLLMILLRCVYWFHPVVWLAFPQIEADMEAACDAAVTGDMETGEKTRYAQTLINFGSNRNLHYTLDMGAHLGRKAMEKRIRSIFMIKKTRHPVRLTMALLVAILTLSCFTTACNPVRGVAASPGSQTPSSTTVSGGSSGDSHVSDSAVSSAILSRLNNDPFAEKKTEGHVTLGTQTQQNGDTLVYVVASYAAFGFEDNAFTIISGSGAIPAVIRLSGSGALISYTEFDEDKNQSAIQSAFSQQYRAGALNPSQYRTELQKQQTVQATAYLQSIGRTAQVQLSGGVRKSFNLSAKASNTLLAMKELNDYPTWIGTREEVVNGVRTVYATGEQDSSGYSLITYTRKSASGTVLQQLQFKVTGDSVVQQPVGSTLPSASTGNTVTGTVTDATMSTITIKTADGATYSMDKDGATVKSDHGILLGDTVEIVYSGSLTNNTAKALTITVKSK